MDVKLLAAAKTETTLNNLTGSPEGPSSPGFPLAPWNKKKNYADRLQQGKTQYLFKKGDLYWN